MTILGIDHEIERLPFLLESMSQLHRIGNVDIIIDLAMNEHESAMQISGSFHYGTVVVPGGIASGVDIYLSV